MENRIFNECCLETMSRIKADSIDLVLTSPPYDNERKYNGFNFDFENIAKEIYRIIKIGGVCVWIVGDSTIKGCETGTSFKQALRFIDIGFNLHDTMIYHKTDTAFMRKGHKKYPGNFEYMFVLTKGKIINFNVIKDRLNKTSGAIMGGSVRNKDGSLKKSLATGKKVAEYGVRSNVWGYSTGFMKSSSDKIAFKHPAIFPEKLAQDHILSWSNIGDLVYDPFCGSGTVPKMAILNNRKFIASEISSEYVDLSRSRINFLINQP